MHARDALEGVSQALKQLEQDIAKLIPRFRIRWLLGEHGQSDDPGGVGGRLLSKEATVPWNTFSIRRC